MERGYCLKKVLFGLALITAGCMMASSSWAAPVYSQAPINIGGDGTLVLPSDPKVRGTQPFGINNSREIVGTYGGFDGAMHGFLLTPDAQGKYTSNPLQLNAPGAIQTWAESVNNIGQIAGGFDDAVLGTQHGFIYDRATGVYTVYDADVPNLTIRQTFIDYINDNGDFSGHYLDTLDDVQHGFMVKGGVFSVMSVPNGSGGSYWTDFDTLTNNNVMAGHYAFDTIDINGNVVSVTNGFVTFDGINFIYIDTPGYSETELERMNNLLQGIGYLTTTNGIKEAFFLDGPYGTPEKIQFLPNALIDPTWWHSYGEGINDDAMIVGYYDDGGVWKGFVGAPSDGNVVPEPSTFLLTGAGIAALGFLARRRNRNSR